MNTTSTTGLSAFSARLMERIHSGMWLVEFESLALELFALQFENNHAYRTICGARNVIPGKIRSWRDIPAVPTVAFKELELTSVPREERTAVFYSSGTTAERRSRHFHSVESLSLYERSVVAWFERNITAGPMRVACLIPSVLEAPNSSLAHMFETVRKRFGREDAEFVGRVAADGGWDLDLHRAVTALDQISQVGEPALVVGTAFAFVHLLDHLAEQNLRFALPAGSLVMETGGYKGRSRSLPKAELHSLIAEYLGVGGHGIVCEYGMSELSSQAYANVNSSRRRLYEFVFPPWARAQIISPETGAEVSEGETGLIRVFDLANVFSVMAIQTEDLGIKGNSGFELLGRAQLAEPRGCSLMAAS